MPNKFFTFAARHVHAALAPSSWRRNQSLYYRWLARQRAKPCIRIDNEEKLNRRLFDEVLEDFGGGVRRGGRSAIGWLEGLEDIEAEPSTPVNLSAATPVAVQTARARVSASPSVPMVSPVRPGMRFRYVTRSTRQTRVGRSHASPSTRPVPRAKSVLPRSSRSLYVNVSMRKTRSTSTSATPVKSQRSQQRSQQQRTTRPRTAFRSRLTVPPAAKKKTANQQARVSPVPRAHTPSRLRAFSVDLRSHRSTQARFPVHKRPQISQPRQPEAKLQSPLFPDPNSHKVSCVESSHSVRQGQAGSKTHGRGHVRRLATFYETLTSAIEVPPPLPPRPQTPARSHTELLTMPKCTNLSPRSPIGGVVRFVVTPSAFGKPSPGSEHSQSRSFEALMKAMEDDEDEDPGSSEGCGDGVSSPMREDECEPGAGQSPALERKVTRRAPAQRTGVEGLPSAAAISRGMMPERPKRQRVRVHVGVVSRSVRPTPDSCKRVRVPVPHDVSQNSWSRFIAPVTPTLSRYAAPSTPQRIYGRQLSFA